MQLSTPQFFTNRLLGFIGPFPPPLLIRKYEIVEKSAMNLSETVLEIEYRFFPRVCQRKLLYIYALTLFNFFPSLVRVGKHRIQRLANHQIALLQIMQMLVEIFKLHLAIQPLMTLP